MPILDLYLSIIYYHGQILLSQWSCNETNIHMFLRWDVKWLHSNICKDWLTPQNSRASFFLHQMSFPFGPRNSTAISRTATYIIIVPLAEELLLNHFLGPIIAYKFPNPRAPRKWICSCAIPCEHPNSPSESDFCWRVLPLGKT